MSWQPCNACHACKAVRAPKLPAFLACSSQADTGMPQAARGEHASSAVAASPGPQACGTSAPTPDPHPRPRSLFTFTRLNNKQLGGADLAMMASNVVLSALSILPYEQASAVGCPCPSPCPWHPCIFSAAFCMPRMHAQQGDKTCCWECCPRLNTAQCAATTALCPAHPARAIDSRCLALPAVQMGRPDADPTAATERAIKMAGILGFSVVSRRGRWATHACALCPPLGRCLGMRHAGHERGSGSPAQPPVPPRLPAFP